MKNILRITIMLLVLFWGSRGLAQNCTYTPAPSGWQFVADDFAYRLQPGFLRRPDISRCSAPVREHTIKAA